MAKVWVKGFTRSDGVKVKGHYREGKNAPQKMANLGLDSKINLLKAGQEIRLGGNGKMWTTAERSSDGKTLRFIRHTPKGFSVFKSTKF